MKKTRNKLLLSLLTFVMAAVLLPVCLTTEAEAATTRTWNGSTWTEWTSTTSLPTSAGYYYLANNVTISNLIDLYSNVYLDLNGKTVTFTGSKDGSAIDIYEGHTFALYDSAGGGKLTKSSSASRHRAIYITNGSYFIMRGGRIENFQNTAQNGGAVLVNGKGYFYMYSGTIYNCKAANGGAVWVESNCNMYMYGGDIWGNSATKDGGGINVRSGAGFYMYGGLVDYNTAGWTGGGIGTNEGTIYISGGDIYGNTVTATSTSDYGGGGIGAWDSPANITITGTARIFDNTANIGGAVVLIRNAKLTMSGGEILSNTATKSYSGVGGLNGYSITYTSGRAATGLGYIKTPASTNTCTITFNTNGGTGGTSSISGQAWNTAMKSITLPTRAGYTFLGYFDATSGGTQYYNANGTSTRNWDYFGTTRTLYAHWLQHTTRCGITAGWQEWTSTNSLPTSAGYYYLANNVTVSGTWTVPSGATYLDLNGHTVQRTSAGTLVQINNGSVLELFDESSAQYRFKSVTYNSSCYYWARDNSGAYSLTGGCLLGNGVGSYGNALVDIVNGTFRMHGGNIVGACNTEYWGYGGVSIGTGGTFEMSGGSIAGCYARCGGGLGGGSDQQVTFLMSDNAAFTYCSAEHGGGMFIRGGIMLKMTGGSINHCYAKGHGGGINWKGNVGADFLGGEITQNSALEWGGGIGNEVNDTFVFGGTMKVYGNTANGQTNNYYPQVVCPLVIGTGENAPQEGMDVGIRLSTGTGIFTTAAANKDDVQYFHSDNASYVVMRDPSSGKLAIGTLIKYTIAYNANGGTGAPASGTATYDVDYTLSSTVPTRTGYTFAGWNTVQNGSGTTYQASASVNNLSSTNGATVTLYARWTENTATLTYNANGHGTAPAAVTMKTTAATSAAGAITGVTGYTFSKWTTNQNGTGTAYNAGAQVKAANANPTAITLYAQWTENTATLTYNANGHGTAPASATMKYTAAANAASALSATGYTFNGWNTAADGKGMSYAAGAVVKAANVDPAATTLYAQWTENTATLTYNANGHGTAPAAATMKYTAATNAADAITGVEGYTFTGWNTMANGKGASYAAGAEVKAANTVPANITLYAQWTENTATLTYEANGHGTAPSSVTMKYSQVASTANITSPGYTFNGWSESADGTGTRYAAGATIKAANTIPANITLYAQWTANTYAIVYHDDAVEGEFTHDSGHPTTHTSGTPTHLLGATKFGYLFDGWFENQACTGTPVTDLADKDYDLTNKQVHLYAKWTVKTYPIENAAPRALRELNNGYIVLSTDKAGAALEQGGTKVTVNVYPNEDCELVRLHYSRVGESGSTDIVKDEYGVYSFQTPEKGVTVMAEFTKKTNLVSAWAGLQARIDAAPTGKATTIQLTGNLTAGETDTALVVSSDKRIILDLKGYTLTGDDTRNLVVNGTLTLKDSADTKGKLACPVNAEAGSKLILSGAEVGVVNTAGKTELRDGTVSGMSVTGGTVTVSGGALTGMTVSCGSRATITGGEIDGLRVDQGSVTVTGGFFTRTEVLPGNRVVITGGSYDADVSLYVAVNYECVEDTDTGRWEVVETEKKVIDPIIVKTVVEGDAITGLEELPEEEQTVVQETITDIEGLLADPVLKGLETGLEEATRDAETVEVSGEDDEIYELSLILNAVKEEAERNHNYMTTVKQSNEFVIITEQPADPGEEPSEDPAEEPAQVQSFTDSSISKSVQIRLVEAAMAMENAEPSEDEEGETEPSALIRAMTFEVKPIASITVKTVSGEVTTTETVTATIPNEAILAPISFRLPVPAAWVTDESDPGSVKVFHEGELKGIYPIRKDTVTDTYYVELASQEFSAYTVENVPKDSEPEEDVFTVAKVGGTEYTNFRDAISASLAGGAGTPLVLLQDLVIYTDNDGTPYYVPQWEGTLYVQPGEWIIDAEGYIEGSLVDCSMLDEPPYIFIGYEKQENGSTVKQAGGVIEATYGDTVELQVKLRPHEGQNSVHYGAMHVELSFDPNRLEPVFPENAVSPWDRTYQASGKLLLDIDEYAALSFDPYQRVCGNRSEERAAADHGSAAYCRLPGDRDRGSRAGFCGDDKTFELLPASLPA